MTRIADTQADQPSELGPRNKAKANALIAAASAADCSSLEDEQNDGTRTRIRSLPQDVRDENFQLPKWSKALPPAKKIKMLSYIIRI